MLAYSASVFNKTPANGDINRLSILYICNVIRTIYNTWFVTEEALHIISDSDSI
jgi:hypothetical protein